MASSISRIAETGTEAAAALTTTALTATALTAAAGERESGRSVGGAGNARKVPTLYM